MPSSATVTITIDPRFDATYVQPTPPTTPVKVMLPYAMANTSDPDGRITVTSPTGKGTSQPGNPGDPYVPGTIKVSGHGNIDLTIYVNDTQLPPDDYTVCGLIFNLLVTARLDFKPAPGRDIFPSFKCEEDGSLTLRRARWALQTYEFVLLIQNDVGGMAIVDPRISNM
jgi:hypothetical protein